MKLIVDNSFTSKGRMCFSLNLAANNLPNLRKDINDVLMNKEVEIFDVKCKVIGIEMFGICDTYEYSNIGIMIKPI